MHDHHLIFFFTVCVCNKRNSDKFVFLKRSDRSSVDQKRGAIPRRTETNLQVQVKCCRSLPERTKEAFFPFQPRVFNLYWQTMKYLQGTLQAITLKVCG